MDLDSIRLFVFAAQLPMDPQSGRMILMGAIFSCCDPILSVAASLSFRDPFYVPLGEEKIADEIRKEFSGPYKSDHIALVRYIDFTFLWRQVLKNVFL